MSMFDFDKQVEDSMARLYREAHGLVSDTGDHVQERRRPGDDMSTAGIKLDHGKLRMDLIPPEAVEAIADILGIGALKYEDRNWEKGMAWSRPFGALMRHLWAWWRGEQHDKDTGRSHLWHAGCNIAFLIAYEARKTGTDDRPNG